MIFEVPSLTEDDHSVLAALDTIRAELRLALGRPRRWSGILRRQARARAVRGSNSIEGITVTEDEAFAIDGGKEDLVSVDSIWLAVRGYSEAMTYSQILARRAERTIDESALLALHFMVQGYDLHRRPGEYRTGEIFVHDDDSDRTVYTGPDAPAVPALMADFVESLDVMAASGLHPMVQGAMAHLNLVMIHPFSDGNGRLSRIVQSMVLYREDVAESDFVSIEEYLGHNTQAYYDVLAEVGGGRWSPSRDAGPWIEFVLSAHYRQARTVQRRLWSLNRIAERIDGLVLSGTAPERATPALEHAFAGWGLRNATYRDLVEVSANTASRELTELVSAGILQRHGEKRGAWYSPAPEHRLWLDELQQQADSAVDATGDPYRALRRGLQIPTSG